MSKPQLAVRIPPELLKELNSYIEKTHTSKTDVVVSAIAGSSGDKSIYVDGCATKVLYWARTAARYG